MTRRIIASFALFVLCLAAVSVLAQVPPQFSADMKFTSQGMSGTGKLYFGGQKVRMEMAAQGQQTIMITHTDRKVAYMIMPAQRMYMEMSTDTGMPQKRGPEWQMYNATNPCANVPNTTCERIGTGVIDGRTCNKWLFTTNGPRSTKTVWIDQKTGIPLRTETSDGYLMEITNIKEGPQTASLFEVPSGFQKLDMGNMTKGRRGQ